MKGFNSLTLAFYFVGDGMCLAQFHTNTITTPNDILAFRVDGGPNDNPTISLQAGVTNIPDIQTFTNHPVVILTADTFSRYSGASPQDVFDKPISLVTPSSSFPTTLYYVCSIHGFFGEIHLSAPLIPPPNTILQIRVGTNIVMTSIGTTTTWTLVPEFRSNIVSGLWAPVPSNTNTYANGTNTTVFNRLDPICGPNVFLRLRQSAP